ncbi:MAG: efflux RND transporter permease subunit [Pontibacterium sp.]
MSLEAKKHGILHLFAAHRVAANLFMALLLLAGFWALKKLNTQFFPNFEIDVVNIQVGWSGAAAEDVEQSIILPLEESLSSVSEIDTLYSTALQGSAAIRAELREGVDVSQALEDIKQRVDQSISDLPDDADTPQVSRIVRYDDIASVLVTAEGATLDELKPLARQFERELLARGISKIDFKGLPDDELTITVAPETLVSLNTSLSALANQINQTSTDLPAGTAAQEAGARQVRSLNQQRDIEGFKQLVVYNDGEGRQLTLADIADVSVQDADGQLLLFYENNPAILLRLRRSLGEDTLEKAEIINQWLTDTQPTLAPNIRLIPYDERWKPINDRIQLLIKNGLSGLVLVVAVLFLFLNARIATWVTLGIPVSFMAALAVLYLLGGSINMISLFGLIMALGIIVDDAIVVGENTLSQQRKGLSGLDAAVSGAGRMFMPVTASSMTTVAAFLPLLLVGGTIGAILIDIPTVVICVILASLVECFFILPGHLSHSFRSVHSLKPSALRLKIDNAFDRFRDGPFRRFVERSLEFRWATITASFALFAICIGTLVHGQLKFTFFPSVEREEVTANVQFAAGTSSHTTKDFLAHLQATLDQANEALGGEVVKTAYAQLYIAEFDRRSSGITRGNEFGSIKVELTPADSRTISNRTLVAEWKKHIQLVPGIEKFSIDQARSGPGGKAISVKLSGTELDNLKAASLDLQNTISKYAGVFNIDDDLPYGKSQLIYQLTPEAQALGLTLESVGRQLRAAFDGISVQSFYQNGAAIDVRITLPEQERNQLSSISQLPILLPNGNTALLANMVTFSDKRGIDRLQRIDGQLAILVTADVNEDTANANEILASIQAKDINPILAKYGIEASFEGSSKDQRETLGDMQMGVIIALVLIYLILAWIFASYSWPFAILLAIPLGLTGAVLGHLLLDLNLTILSLFGFFGLSGIVINDSIVLVTFYQQLRAEGLSVREAAVEATCQRLRAVLLTTLTTVAGLLPIIFETSTQAQFLIPMAVSIVFGLAYGTLLILLFVPASLTVIESLRGRLGLKPVTSAYLHD